MLCRYLNKPFYLQLLNMPFHLQFSWFFFCCCCCFLIGLLKRWNASWISMSSLCRSHANLLYIVPISVNVLPKWAPTSNFVYACMLSHSVIPTLCNPMDCSTPGFSVYGIFQARILKWVVISSSRGSSEPGIESASPQSHVLAGRFFDLS